MSTLHITNYLRAPEGTPTRLTFSPFNSRTTYGRVQDSSQPFSQQLNAFRRRDWEMIDEDSLPQNSPHVQLVKKVEDVCFDEHYPFQFLGGRGGQIIEESRERGIQYVVNRHFDGVDSPRAGDLVVYYNKNEHPMATAIFRQGIKVESIWGGLLGGYVFLHDFFAAPDYFGDTLKIYRLRESGPLDKPFPPKPERPLFTQIGPVFHFDPTGANLALRKLIEEIENTSLLTQKFPQIQCLDLEPGITIQCTAHALKQTLPAYKKEAGHSVDLLGKEKSKILEKFYEQVGNPQPGDLAVYSTNEGERVHFGIYLGPDLIESKWGLGRVYRHPFFYTLPIYGDTLTFYRVKPEARYEPGDYDIYSAPSPS